ENVAIAGCDRVAHTGVDRVDYRLVERARRSASEAHVRDSARGVIRCDPVDTGNHARRRTTSVAIEHPNGYQSDGFRNTVCSASDRPRDVCTVTIAIVRAVTVGNGSVPTRSSAAELGVRCPD